MSAVFTGNGGILEVLFPFLPNMGGRLRLHSPNASLDEMFHQGPTTWSCQAQEVARVLRGEIPVRTPASDGLANMRVIDAVYRAAGMRVRGS